MSDPSSPIRDFYPEHFAQDPNGKKFSWMWVVLLPFIDERRLVGAVESVAATFTDEERRRNELGNDVLFVHESAPLAKILAPVAVTEADVAALAAFASPARQAELARVRASVAASGVDDAAAIVVNVSDPSGSGDATRVLTPAISPAVTEALVAAGGRLVLLRPDVGDREGKGLSAQCVPISAALKSGHFAPLAARFVTGWGAAIPTVERVRSIAVGFLPPTRRAHLCSLLPGAEAPPPLLTVEDDPSGTVPRLSRGICVADLAQLACDRTRGVGGGGGARGG
jgi:hypothetical protein